MDQEPLPNGETINLGAYGGTDHTSKALPDRNGSWLSLARYIVAAEAKNQV